MYNTKYSEISQSSSNSSSSTISKIQQIAAINHLNQINSLTNSYPLLYPSYPSQNYNISNNHINPFNFVANQIISPMNNNYEKKRFSYNNNINNINNDNNFAKGTPVPIHQDIKKTQCCAHNGCNAYISDVLHLLKGLKELGLDKKLKLDEQSSENSKEIKDDKKNKIFNKKKKRENKEEKKKKEKAERWWKLAKGFINIYYFYSSAKKYSMIYGHIRNTQIEQRTNNFEEEIDLLKEWILTLEDLCWDELDILIDENCAFEKGDSKNKIRKESLKIISILKKYIETFLISRLDFDYMGKTRNITEEQSAMILAFLLLSIISSQEIFCNIRETVKQYRNYANVLISAKYLGVILHMIVKNTFKNDVEPLDDIFALFNYYRNYHLENEFIEKKENKNISKKNYLFEGLPNVDEDEYSLYFIKEEDIEAFFDTNEEFVETCKNNIFIWSLKLSKLIKDKFSRKDPYLLPIKQIAKPEDKIFKEEEQDKNEEDNKEKKDE